METQAAETRTAERMMTGVEASSSGLNVSFADGLVSFVPWSDIEEVERQSDVDSIELGNPYEAIIRTRDGRVAEIPWDFARHFGDPEYRARNAEIALRGQRKFAARLRSLRCSSNLSQQQLAELSRVDQTVIERIEVADQPPTLEIIRRLAAAMGRPVQSLMMDDGCESGGEETADSNDPAHENVGR